MSLENKKERFVTFWSKSSHGWNLAKWTKMSSNLDQCRIYGCLVLPIYLSSTLCSTSLLPVLEKK